MKTTSIEPFRLISRARAHGDRVAIQDASGSHTYRDLLTSSREVAGHLLAERPDLDKARVAFLVDPGYPWVAVCWGIWRAGGIAVPLAAAHPPPELTYAIAESDAEIIIADTASEARLRPVTEALGRRFLNLSELLSSPPREDVSLPSIARLRPALILFTSGTTGRPKGVVLTHAHLEAQMESLVEAWQWRAEDHILEVLPLHHLHGIVNIVLCALWSGAVCEILPRFDADEVWRRFLTGRVTLFMAVPTIYVRLIAAWETCRPEERRALSRAAEKLRLMVSGSAALPVTVLERWQEITGHRLLERYGMSEIGMALGNPLAGPRIAAAVGSPLPGMEVRLVDASGHEVADAEPGEIEVRGEAVFNEYWRRPEATRKAFRNGWFRTGDLAIRDQGVYRILGRQSVDILKTGGEKVSALEIEAVLRNHPAIADCAVVGIADSEWGQRVAAAVVLRARASLDLEELRSWARQHLATYKIPSLLRVCDELPRNTLGKVLKPRIAEDFRASS